MELASSLSCHFLLLLERVCVRVCALASGKTHVAETPGPRTWGVKSQISDAEGISIRPHLKRNFKWGVGWTPHFHHFQRY